MTTYKVCEMSPPCISGTCETITSPPGFKCRCAIGYMGDRCELFDPCTIKPCENSGVCEMNNFSGSVIA